MEQITPQIKPTAKQYQAYQYLWDKVTRFILFGGGAEGGKSWLGAEWLLTNCYRYPGSKWFLGRNELTRLMGSSYQSFLKICQHHGIPKSDWKFNGQYHYIEFVCKLVDCETYNRYDGHGSRIDLIDLKFLPTDPMFQRFGSYEYTGGWIEEAGEVHFLAFDVLKSRVGRWKNKEFGLEIPKILLTCNPEQNWLYRIFYKPWKKDELPEGYEFVQALYNDNPYTAKEAGERLDQVSDPVLRKRLKLGLWEYNASDNALVTYDAIIDMFTNTLSDADKAGRYFTGDVARYGSDKIVFGNWKGLELIKLQWKKNRGIDQTANDVKTELQQDQIPFSQAIVDDDGVGGGVTDTVRGIKGFVGNSSPLENPDVITNSGKETLKEKRKENYKNLRSQCGFMLAEMIMDHKIAITADMDETTKEELIEDLQALLRKKDTPIEAPLQLISKDEIKQILGRSPDFADMMSMRMYFRLRKPVVFKQNNDPGGVKPFFEGLLA